MAVGLPTERLFEMQEFDYVIVGGGSAGCCLAGRLAENTEKSVCLIEAGPTNASPRVSIPLGLVTLMGSSTYDWRFKAEPLSSFRNKQPGVPRGKTLGGSGSINSMLYIRGRPSDYDAWAKKGCTGWNWRSVLPYFKRAENNSRFHDELHGTEGPLHVQGLRTSSELNSCLVEAGESVGIPHNPDFNGNTQEGLGEYQVTMKAGRRWSAADAYLKPVMRRSNLTVLTGSNVKKIGFGQKRAQDLTVLSEEGKSQVKIRKELILCAGSIGSPELLLRSGVGPGSELQSSGLSIVHHLPGVGKNLQDHPALPMFFAGGSQGYALSWATLPEIFLSPFRYFLSRRGLWSSNTVEAGGFARTSKQLKEPDVQFHFIPGRMGHLGKMLVWGRGYYGDVCVLKPKSRGSVTLNPKQVDGPPRIDLNLLSETEDQDTLIRGARLARSILSQPAMTKQGAMEICPGPGVETDEQWFDYICERLGTAYHPVGTCPMGPLSDEFAVVDADLKVHGLDNVRVVDASVMPEIVAGNTNAPTMMIAEVASDKIVSAN
ncbi:MAG: GMC family oxidoreductase N-terminal domain-containing protein [Pseudomonadota bacterium]